MFGFGATSPSAAGDNKIATDTGTDTEGDTVGTIRTTVDYRDVALPLGFLLTVMSIALPVPAADRADLLFAVASGRAVAGGADGAGGGLEDSTDSTVAAAAEEGAEEAATPAPTLPSLAYIAAADGAFQGAKPGYVFKSGAQGVGYYVDLYGYQVR